MPINIDDSINPIADGTPKGLIKTINGLANAIKNITGKSSWKDAPDISIQQITTEAINSNWLIKTADYTASHGDKIICDARSGNFTITFPANPSPGQFISLVGIGVTVVNPVFLNLQGKKLNAEISVFVMLQKVAIITTVAFFDNTVGWIADTTITRSSTYSELVLAANPWGFWRLRESSDVVAIDSSPNMRNGNYNGGILLSAIGEPATFNGVDSIVSIPYEQHNPNVFTLECRVRTTQSTGGIFSYSDTVLSGGGAYDRNVYFDQGKIGFYLFPSNSINLLTAQTFNDGEWHTISVTLGDEGMRIYVDGELKASNPDVTSGYSYFGYWHIGYTVQQGFFNGEIGDASITYSQLTSDEIAERYAVSIL